MSCCHWRPVVGLVVLASLLVITPPSPVHPAEPGATVVIHDRVVGQSPRFIGANPGLTIAPNWEAWVRDSRMNAAREWANMEEIEPQNDDGVYGDGVSDDDTFEAARAAVLASPDDNPEVRWSGFHFQDFDRRLGTYDRLGITPVVVIRGSGSGSTRQVNIPAWMANVPTTSADAWEWWEYAFAVAYHAAREHGITRFEIHSEPDRSVQGFGGRVDDYGRLLSWGADAAREGVQAGLAARGGPSDQAVIYAPGLAEPTASHGSYLRQVLTNSADDVDVIDYHQYSQPWSGEYAERAAEVRSIAGDAGVARPIFVSEYNISRSGEHGDVDTPADALGLAEAQRQLAQAGIEGMLLYRFNFPAEFRNLSVIRSGDGSGRALVDETFGYQVFKQATTALAGARDMLAADVTGPATWLATRDDDRVFLLGISREDTALPIDLDLSELGLDGRGAVIRVAAVDHPNDLLGRPTVQAGHATFVQPPSSAVLVVISRGSDPGPPLSLRLKPGSVELAHSRVQQLAAWATFADGSERDVSDWVQWSSDDPSTARANSTGLVVGLVPGTASVTACWDATCAPPVAIAVQ